jgi:hypothetical protein
VTVRPQVEVDKAFDGMSGEGNRTQHCCLDPNRRYFARQASREGFELDDEVFERIEVV